MPGGAVGRDRGPKGAHVHLVCHAHRYPPERAVPHAQQLARLPGPAVGLAGAVEHQPRRARPLQPVRPDVEPRPGVPRHREANEVRDGSSAHQQPARLRGEAEQLGHPPDHLSLHQRRRLIVPCEVRVHARRQHVGQHGERRARAHHPAPEAGVDVSVGIGEDVLAELLVDHRRIGGLARGGLVQCRACSGGHRLPDRPLAHPLQIVHHVVHHAVAERAELAPVGGIEGLFRTRLGRHRAVGSRMDRGDRGGIIWDEQCQSQQRPVSSRAERGIGSLMERASEVSRLTLIPGPIPRSARDDTRRAERQAKAPTPRRGSTGTRFSAR